MSASRAQVMAAVLARIQAMTFLAPINGKVTWQNNPATMARLRLWSDVQPSEQPAAFLVTHREVDEYRNLGTLRRRLELLVWCYSRTDDQALIGATDLDTMMQAFEATFNVIDQNSTGANTLDGLVYWCRIEGRVVKDPGDIDNQALLIVPLVVEMP